VGVKPTVATLGASGPDTNNLALTASINPGGRHTTAWFHWGATTNLGTVTPPASVGSGAVSSNFSSSISNFAVSTMYYCRAVASNSAGVVTGATVAFWIGPPLAVTLPATVLNRSNAWLNGRVTADSLPSTAWFEWGTNSSYGNTILLGQLPAQGSLAALLRSALNGLDPTATYHFRVAASNSLGVAVGADQQFTGAHAAYSESVLADQPLVYYRFDEVGGVTAENLGTAGVMANGTYNATVLLGNPSLVPAFGLAAGFNNTNSSVAVPALGTNSQFTVEFWLKPRTVGRVSSADPHSIYSSIYTADLWEFGALHTHLIGDRSDNGNWEWAIAGNNPPGAYLGNASTPLLTNSWVHLAAAYDSPARRLVFYWNGQAVRTNNFTTARPVNFSAAHIGAWVGPSSTPNWFNGEIDEFAIYTNVLSASRIQAHYQTAIGTPELLSVRTTNRLNFSWVGPGFRLQSNTNLNNPGGWTNVPGGSNSPVSLTISNSGHRYFRLKWP
jgi:hypothetical protein